MYYIHLLSYVYFIQLDAQTEKMYTYRQVIDRIQKLAAGLKNIGVRQGDVLCALTFNTIEYPIIWYATTLIGATFQTASPLYADGRILTDSFVE